MGSSTLSDDISIDLNDIANDEKSAADQQSVRQLCFFYFYFNTRVIRYALC